MIETLRIGERLLRQQLITDEQLNSALEMQQRTDQSVGEILVQQGVIDQSTLNKVLAEHFGVALIDVKSVQVDATVAALMSQAQAKQLGVVFVSQQGNKFLLAMIDPSDIYALDLAEQLLDRGVVMPALVVREDFAELLGRAYSVGFAAESTNIMSFPPTAEQPPSYAVSKLVESLDFGGGDELDGEDAPVVQLVGQLFSMAAAAGASDIHIEPCANGWRLRQRIDGRLQEELIADASMVRALTLRLKLLANLNISERRMPQDGRFSIPIENREIDVRISTMPIQHGESVVMRLLDKGSVPLNLDKVSMEPGLLARFRKLINRPHGLVLVTGPTGSGKTTTLYGALSELNKSDNKIITVEDPVEYQLDRINQVQVRPKIDLTFARVLRTTLRQDPDILLVGEIRDEETAQIAMRAAITGHLVLSTLHTNDAIGSAQRLVDMGVPGYLVGGALCGVMAQRLIRRVCDGCKLTKAADSHELATINALLDKPVKSFELSQGAGCEACNHSGYRGRLAVHELLEIDNDLRFLLTSGDTHRFSEVAASRPGYKPLVHRALEMAKQGETSLPEVERLVVSLAETPSTAPLTKSADDIDLDDLELVINA